MRVFVGIKLDDQARDRTIEAMKPFKKIGTPIRWIKPENIHLTLKFIGEIGPERYSEIERALLGFSYDIRPFLLKISGFGKFGKGAQLNIFWVGVEGCEELKKLYQSIEEILEKSDIRREERPFFPHITLGRNKRYYNFNSFFRMIEEKAEQFVTELRVKDFQIFRSQLSKNGASYTVLKEIRFA